ncbi:MAG: GNAT family N-acetyltransferase [Pseudobdellovibrio sp.]
MVAMMIENVMQQFPRYFSSVVKKQTQIPLRLQVGPYVLKLAESKKEMFECFRLRHDVFCVEMAGYEKISRMDFDKFDSFCDHLIIVHEETNSIVGTYRLNFSESSKEFYTSTEFDISSWLNEQSSPFVELGRACIAKEHRRGVVISLLWRGIVEYMNLRGVSRLIGCSSVKVTDARSAALIYKYFELKGQLAQKIFQPTKEYQMKDFLFWMIVFSGGLNENQMLEAEEKIPSLLKSYIKAGAKVASYPAYDEDFKCLDFVTTMNREDLSDKLIKKFST